MTTEIIGYIGVDSGCIVIGDAAISDIAQETGPFHEMKQIKADAPVAQGFVLPTLFGDGIYAVLGHYEDDNLVAVTIELEQ